MVRTTFGVAMAALVATGGAGLAAEHRVGMAGMTYRPAALTVKVGDVIVFVNDDTENHDVFVPTRGFAVDLGAQKPQEARELRLGKAGRFEVECVLHEGMAMTVTVAP